MGRKVCLLLPIACLVGFLIGSWGARDELRAFKEHAKEAKEKSAAKSDGFDTFARMVKIPAAARRPRRTSRAGKAKPISPIAAKTGAKAKDVPPPVVEAEASDGAPAQDAKPAAEAPPKRLSPDDLRARIEEAQELWRTRVDVARAQWKAKLKLQGESERAFDAALQEMNERLYDCVSTLAEIVGREEKLSPETGLRLVGETSSIMADAYDRIGACVAPEMRGEVAEINMVDFIDPGVAEPLVSVQDKLEMSVQRQEGRAR